MKYELHLRDLLKQITALKLESKEARYISDSYIENAIEVIQRVLPFVEGQRNGILSISESFNLVDEYMPVIDDASGEPTGLEMIKYASPYVSENDALFILSLQLLTNQKEEEENIVDYHYSNITNLLGRARFTFKMRDKLSIIIPSTRTFKRKEPSNHWYQRKYQEIYKELAKPENWEVLLAHEQEKFSDIFERNIYLINNRARWLKLDETENPDFILSKKNAAKILESFALFIPDEVIRDQIVNVFHQKIDLTVRVNLKSRSLCRVLKHLQINDFLRIDLSNNDIIEYILKRFEIQCESGYRSPDRQDVTRTFQSKSTESRLSLDVTKDKAFLQFRSRIDKILI